MQLFTSLAPSSLLTPGQFKNATITGILYLWLQKARPAKLHDDREVIVFKLFSLQAFSNSSGLKSEKRRFATD